MIVHLSKRDLKTIKNVIKISSRSKYNYIACGFCACLSVLGLFIGVLIDRYSGYFMLLYCGTIALYGYFMTRLHEKFAKILKTVSNVVSFEESPPNDG